MGIKENFTQAVKELTGIGGKEKEAEKGNVQNPDSVEGLKKAVDDGSGASTREITLEAPDWSVPDWDGSEASTVRPIPREQGGAETSGQVVADSTPAAEAFLSGGSSPVSLFGGGQQQQTAQQPMQTPFQQQQPAQQPMQTPFQQQQTAQQPMQTPFRQQQTAQQPMQTPFQQQQTAQQPPLQPIQPVQSFSQTRTAGIHDDNELTIISRNTIIDGNVRSFADMSIDGDIKGDVETTKNIDLNGKVIGNISCNNAMMHTSQIQGNVRMKGSISMKRDTLLIGDLMSTYAEVNGKVKGNLDVVGKADLKGDAVVFGDISASTITVEDGAIIQGYVTTTFLNKEETKNIFPDTVVISNESDSGAEATPA
jgi:cytoskeletal protein CcmA (bactofilin family)